jgi:4,5-dihydroxyphthalate decarboxylase
MPKRIQLSVAVAENPRTLPIINGDVEIEGVDLTVIPGHPSEIFWRQLHFAEFDIAEMSMSSFIIAMSHGDDRFVGLPVFTTRRFFHTWTLVRNDRGIQEPKDLEGKRIGVPEYQQTAALWNRGILENEFGVDLTSIEWFMERGPQISHGGATGFQPPPGIRLNQIPPEKNIGMMMDSGELDATLLYLIGGNLVDRSTIDLDNHKHVQKLFNDPSQEGARYFQKSGVFPINHGMVLRRSLHEEHPWLAINIVKAFVEAKNRAAKLGRETFAAQSDMGLLPPEARSALSTDLFPYGVVSNKITLETISKFSNQQGLTSRTLNLDEIFAPSTLEM